ncbi:citrate lyase holo-[acyl-carrier protein] synthase [Oleispirillum naphthae]|uniref:citrate lyase holo-[acyl-carrier protein] synthase n=1 Tax=Oleispirillum naphthae TaxID=2838853 RepID=UPI00308267C7
MGCSRADRTDRAQRPAAMPPGGAAVLDAREARWLRKTALAERFGASVLALALNIPGPDKNLPGVRELLADLSACLDRLLAARENPGSILHDETAHGADGPYRLLVSDMAPLELKRLAARLEEEHPFGRLADADVLSPDGGPVSRRDIGLAPRKCFLCGEDAALCRARAGHSTDELRRHVEATLDAAKAASAAACRDRRRRS